MRIKIIADSACDLPCEVLRHYDIDVVPLYINKGSEQFKDGDEISAQDIFAYFDETGELCSTAAVSIFDFSERYKKYCSDFDAVIQITIGSEFSSCYQNACVAAKDFPNVYVVDSANLCTGEGLIVIKAARMAQEGLGAEEIAARLRELTPKVETSFLLEHLNYIVKGGRCSAAAALGANILKLKPCIEIHGGKMTVGKKYRGTFEKCIEQYIKERVGSREDIDKSLLVIANAAVPDETIAAARKTVEECAEFDEIIESVAGCTISCHCGPHTFALFFIRK